MRYTLTDKSHSYLDIRKRKHDFNFIPNSFNIRTVRPAERKCAITYNKMTYISWFWLAWEFELSLITTRKKLVN